MAVDGGVNPQMKIKKWQQETVTKGKLGQRD